MRSSRLRHAVLTACLVTVAGPWSPVTGPAEVHAADAPWTLPTVPPRCSSQQRQAGDVAGCVITEDGALPEDRGWPEAPFPSSWAVTPPPGWRWNGGSYNGSPALAGYEAQLIFNNWRIGGMGPGAMRTFAAAMPLFEGFFAEVQARGYYIAGGGSYAFRCTASSRRDCYGLGKDKLSNHAFGLAVDINSGANPLRTYYGVGGASACMTPMITNMPQWVIQTAEKWGLYWGGYGWSRGCSSPAQIKSSAQRDPTHFEFNGSPEEAHAIWVHNVGAASCVDRAANDGSISNYCYARPETPGGDIRTVITTDAPAGAQAALVNITATGVNALGYVTAESCGPVAGGTRSWSNGNVRTWVTSAGAAIVPLDSQGRFCLYQSGPMHSIVDVQGFFLPAADAPNGSLYTPVEPVRALDTRTDEYCTPDGTCHQAEQVPGGEEVRVTSPAPSTATATLANLTVTGSAAPGYLTADACASLQPGPQTRSNLNFFTGHTVANLGVMPSVSTADGMEFCTHANTDLHEIVDVQGFFGPVAAGGLAFTRVTPTRLVDTRACWTDAQSGQQHCGIATSGDTIMHLRAPAGTAAVAVTLTAITPLAEGYLSVAACDTMQPGPQPMSNVNSVVGAAVANLAVVPVGADGTICVYASSTTHVAVDLMGTFAANGALRFVPITPTRVHDTRAPT